MTSLDTEFVERYQVLYEKDPNSKVFALLGEAYRKMGLLDKALRVCQRGIENHPEFSSGHVALGRTYLSMEEPNKALRHLEKAKNLSPENILAHKLLAQTLLELRRPKEALAEYKMVLLLNPNDATAQKVVKKLESLTADEFDDEIFSHYSLKKSLKKKDFIERKLEEVTSQGSPSPAMLRALERMLSLADAFAARNDIEKALETLEKTEEQWGPHPEIEQRINMLRNMGEMGAEDNDSAAPIVPLNREQIILEERKGHLENILNRIKSRRN